MKFANVHFTVSDWYQEVDTLIPAPHLVILVQLAVTSTELRLVTTANSWISATTGVQLSQNPPVLCGRSSANTWQLGMNQCGGK